VTGERPLVQIFVRDNNVDQALKALKKKMQREGSFREMKRHVHYEKPSESAPASRRKPCVAPASWPASAPSVKVWCLPEEARPLGRLRSS